MNNRLAFTTVILFFLLLVSGCLTVEKKSYLFEVNADGSGRLTIKYINILSIKDDTVNVSEEDFAELVGVYLEGSQPEDNFPDALLVSKRLYEHDKMLCGEVVYEFEKPSDVKLYRYENRGPFMFCINCSYDNEAYAMSNGSYGGENMPVVFYEEDLEQFELLTSITVPDENTVSLLSQYRNWKLSQE